MSPPARPPALHSWAWSHQHSSTSHSTERCGGSHQQHNRCNQDKFDGCTVYGLLVRCWLKLNISFLLHKYHNIPSPRYLKISWVSRWRLQPTTPHPRQMGLPVSGLNLSWRPIRDAERTPTGEKDDCHPPCPATSTGWAAVFRINARHHLHFELSPKIKPVFKLHTALQKY